MATCRPCASQEDAQGWPPGLVEHGFRLLRLVDAGMSTLPTKEQIKPTLSQRTAQLETEVVELRDRFNERWDAELSQWPSIHVAAAPKVPK